MPRFLISDGTRSQYLARLGAKAAHERLITLHTDGGLFRLNAQRLYEKVCDRFDNRGVKNLTPSANKEFLIRRRSRHHPQGVDPGVRPPQGVTIDEADKIFISLTARLLVVIGIADAARVIADNEVDHYNETAVRAARDHVMHRPGVNFAGTIATWRA